MKINKAPSFYLQIDPRAPDGGEFEGPSHAPFELNDNFVELQNFSEKFLPWAGELVARIDYLEQHVRELEELFADFDETAYRGLQLLGFDSYEDLEESVWAKKPKSEPIYEGTGILDLKVTGHKEVSA